MRNFKHTLPAKQIMSYCLLFIIAFGIEKLIQIESHAASRGIKINVQTRDGQKIALYSNSYALVVGNGEYTNGWDLLPGALRDVKDEDNRLLFYYASHGHTEKMATGEELGYIVMVDAPAPEKDQMGFNLASVDMQSLVTQAKMIQPGMFYSCSTVAFPDRF